MQYRSKRLVSLMLVVLMVVSMFPGTALASESDTLILGDGLVLGDNVTIITDGEVLTETESTETESTETESTETEPTETESTETESTETESTETESTETESTETEAPAEEAPVVETPAEEAPVAPALETGEETAARDGADTTLPTAPDMSGSVINVTAANAQYVLDGAYGDINGKTINFTENITEVLDLARTTKYVGSGTQYYAYNGDGTYSSELKTVSEDMSIPHGSNKYYRTLSNVTFTADEGVTVAGFTFSAGHVVGPCTDYVRDLDVESGSAYYDCRSLSGITFRGLTVTGRFDAKLYLEGATVSGITFDGCTFTGTTDNGSDGSNAAIKFLADSQYFTNVTVKNCSISNYFQGVNISGVDGAVITGNTISNTTHNAIALQSCDAGNPAKGSVTVTENYISGAGDRAIRINYVESATIAINNNIMVDSGDSDGQLIKATSLGTSSSVDLENNYWDGKDVATAVASGLTAPTTVGITGGSWSNDVSDYLADGYSYDSTTGTVTSTPAAPTVTEVATYEALVEALANGGEIKLTADIRLDTAITVIDGTTIDLNDKTLTVAVENSYYNNATIKNGNIVLTKDDVHVCDGYFLVNAGKTLVIDGVTMTSAEGGIKGYAVFHLKTGANLDITNSTLNISNNEYTAGYIVYAGESTATLDVTGSTITGSKVNGVVHATTVIDTSTFTVTDAVEHGINRSALTIDDSTVTISGGTGRGITAEHGDLVITGNSTVNITDMGEATIELREHQNLTVAETAKVTLDVAVNNTSTGTVTGEEYITVTPAISGTVNGCFIMYPDGASYVTTAINNVYANESIVLKLFDAEGNLLATSSLVDNDRVLLGKLKAEISGTILIAAQDDWWNTVWEKDMLRADHVPATITLYVDGQEMDSTDFLVRTNTELPLNWAEVNGVPPAPVAQDQNGAQYTSLQAAFDAAAGKGGLMITLLSDITLDKTATLSVTGYSHTLLDLNGYDITSSASPVISAASLLSIVTTSEDTSTITCTAEGGTVIKSTNMLTVFDGNMVFKSTNGMALDANITDISGGTWIGDLKITSGVTSDDETKAPLTGGTYTQDVSAYCAGYACLPTLDGHYVVGEAPTATVNDLGAMTIPAGEYMVYGDGDTTTAMPLSFVMQFLADQTEEDMATSPYADWYGDFVITFTGIENGSFTADGCYLAGYYGDFGWVKVPVDGMTIENGARYPVMLGVGMGQKYDYICTGVKDFRCAMYIPDAILDANPNLQVNLELSVVDNSKGEDAATEALVKQTNIYQVAAQDYDVDDFQGNVASVTSNGETTKYQSLANALAAVGAGDTLTLLQDVTISEPLTVTADLTIDGKGKTLTYTGTDRAIEMPNNADDQLDVSISNLTVDCTGSYCQRGINYNDDGTLTLNKVTVNGTNLSYALNLPGMSDGAKVDITDSSLTGCIALNVWGENAVIDVTGTDLTSVDKSDAENYAAVKLNNDGDTAAEGTVINITGGSITALDENGEASSAVTNGTDTGTVNVSETTVVTGNITEIVAAVRYEGSTDSYGCYTLQSAIATAAKSPNAYVVLLKDVTLDTMVTVNGTVVLDLNGKTIGTDFTASSGNDMALCVAYGADLTINDSSEKQTGVIDGSGVYGAVKMTNTGDDANNGTAKLTVNGGTLKGNYYAIAGNGGRHGTEITISGGTLTATQETWGYGIFHPQDGTLTVTGGTIKAATGIEMRAGTLNVTGGTIQSTATALTTGTSDSGTTVSGAAIAISQHNTNKAITVTVTGGTLEGTYALYQDRLVKTYSPSTNLSATIGADVAVNGTVEAAEEGWAIPEAEDGSYALCRRVASITSGRNTYYYETLADAIADAYPGETVELLCNINEAGPFNITDGDNITVKGNGYTINCEDGFYVTGGKLTLSEDLTVNASVYNAVYIRGGEVITSANLSAAGAYAAIQGNGSYAGDVTINGGTITAASNVITIYWPQNGKLTINDGTITGPTAVYVKSGALEITGGTITGNGTKQSYEYVASGATSTGAAVVIENVGGETGYEEITSVSITGGTFITENASRPVVSYAATAANSEAVAVKNFISGGTYNKSLAPSVVAADMKATKNAETGLYEIIDKVYVVAVTDAEGNVTYGETIYDSAIKNAITDGSTITLLDNVTSGQLIIDSGKSVTLELNGYEYSTSGATIFVEGGGSLTIQDSSDEQTGKIYSTGDVVTIDNGSLTIKSGTLETRDADDTVISASYATVTIEGGKLIGAGNGVNMIENSAEAPNTLTITGGEIDAAGFGVTGNGTYDYSTFTIEGGTITGDSIGIYHPQNGTLTITGGTITGGTGVYVKAGNVAISGDAVITGNGDKAEPDVDVNTDGATSTGDALVVHNEGETTAYGPISISVTGGTFSSTNGTPVAAYANGEEPTYGGFITGGQFSSIPEDALVAEGYVAETEKDPGTGLYGIVEADPVAAIGSTTYTSLQAAIDAADGGDTVKLLADVALDSYVFVGSGKEVNLNLMGHAITAAESCAGSMFFVGGGAKLTINDSSDDQPGSINYAGNTNVTSVITVYDAAKLVVNAGAITGYYYGIAGNGIAGRGNTEITINGGSISAVGGTTTIAGYPGGILVGDGIFHPQEGTLTIFGGTISGPSGIEMRAGTLSVNGGTITGKTDAFYAIPNGSGNTVYGAAVAISQHSTNLPISATINGGTLTGAKALYEEDTTDDGSVSGIALAVNGGSFTGEVSSENCTKFISGGTYATEPAEDYIAEGFAAEQNEDGSYGIAKEAVVTTGEAAIGETVYKTLEEAIVAANTSETAANINILSNVETKPTTQISKAMNIVNASGFTLWGKTTAEALAEDGVVADGYTVTNVANMGMIFSIAPSGTEGTTVAKIDTVEYTTVKAALEAAQSGETVVLVADSDESTSDMIIPKGVTLDLQAFDLKVRSLNGANGSYVTGTLYSGANGSHARLNADTLILGEAPYVDSLNYNVLPIWDSTENTYVFTRYIINTTADGTGLRIDEENSKLQFQFVQNMSGAVRKAFLLDGSSDNKMDVCLTLSWMQDTAGLVELTFTYSDIFVGNVAKDAAGTTHYRFTMSDYVAQGVDLDTLQVQAYIRTDSGVLSLGEIFEQEDATLTTIEQ